MDCKIDGLWLTAKNIWDLGLRGLNLEPSTKNPEPGTLGLLPDLPGPLHSTKMQDRVVVQVRENLPGKPNTRPFRGFSPQAQTSNPKP